MDYRRVIGFLVAAGLVLVAGCGGGGGGGTDGPIAGAPTVSGVSLSSAPTFAGGPVTINAHVTAESGVSTVVAKVTDPEDAVTNVTMTKGAADLYSGVFNAPANGTTAAKTYSVVVVVKDTAARTASSTAVTFAVPGLVPPPPPPPK